MSLTVSSSAFTLSSNAASFLVAVLPPMAAWIDETFDATPKSVLSIVLTLVEISPKASGLSAWANRASDDGAAGCVTLDTSLGDGGLDVTTVFADGVLDERVVVVDGALDERVVVTGGALDDRVVVAGGALDDRVVVAGDALDDRVVVVEGALDDRVVVVDGASEDRVVVVDGTSDDRVVVVDGASDERVVVVGGALDERVVVVDGALGERAVVVDGALDERVVVAGERLDRAATGVTIGGTGGCRVSVGWSTPTVGPSTATSTATATATATVASGWVGSGCLFLRDFATVVASAAASETRVSTGSGSVPPRMCSAFFNFSNSASESRISSFKRVRSRAMSEIFVRIQGVSSLPVGQTKSCSSRRFCTRF